MQYVGPLLRLSLISIKSHAVGMERIRYAGRHWWEGALPSNPNLHFFFDALWFAFAPSRLLASTDTITGIISFP